MVLLAVGRAASQNDSPEAPVLPHNLYSVTGNVVNAVTGEPVRRALVQVVNLPGLSPSMLTDSEGRFQFELPETVIGLTVRKPGFFNEQELQPDTPQPPVFFRVGAATPAVTLKLLPEAGISGHVVTLKGEPIEDVPVRVFEERVFDGRRRWERRGQTMSEEDGRFRLGNLVPGVYLLAAGPSFTIREQHGTFGGAPQEEAVGNIFYPGVTELNAATPIVVSAGQRVEADFSLKLEPLFKVSGIVIGLASGTGSAPQFVTRAGEPVNVAVNFDVQNGKFDAKVPGGSYTLFVRTPDPSGALLSADVPLVVAADVTGITVPLAPALTLAIRAEIRHGSTTSASGGSETEGLTREGAQPAGTGSAVQLAQIRLLSVEPRLEWQEFHGEIQDSTFFVRNLVPGKYIVELTPKPHFYVQSAVSGTTDIMRENLAIAAGHAPDPLEVVLRDDGAQLSGTIVLDGRPAPGTVLLIPSQGSLNGIRVAQSGAAGEFQIDDLAPGDYKIIAFDTVQGFEFRDPDLLAPYLSRAARVTLAPAEESSIRIERAQAGK